MFVKFNDTDSTAVTTACQVRTERTSWSYEPKKETVDEYFAKRPCSILFAGVRCHPSISGATDEIRGLGTQNDGHGGNARHGIHKSLDVIER